MVIPSAIRVVAHVLRARGDDRKQTHESHQSHREWEREGGTYVTSR